MRRGRIAVTVIGLLLGTVAGALAGPGEVTLYPVVDPAITRDVPQKHGTVLDQHRIELRWSESQDPSFQSYRIYYALEPGVDTGDGFVAEITDRTTTTCTVAGLNLATPYYFRVYVNRGAKGTGGGSNEVVGITAANSFPWSDDLEGTLDGWDLAATTWDTTSSWSNSPTHSFTDSPDSNYTNLSNRRVQTAINLMSAQMPVLIFQHYYNIETDGDFGYIEVSEDGGTNWEIVQFITGSSGGWLEEKIDLTPYRGNVDLKIRWRLATNASGVSDGWYVDDVSIDETEFTTLALPVYDNVNDAAHSDSLWFSASWSRTAGGAGPGHYFQDSPYGDFPEYVSTKLTLVHNADLSSATDPWLVFRHRLDLEFQNSARVEVSIDGGANWSILQSWAGPDNVADWTQVALDLSEYAGGALRVRFHLLNVGVNTADGWDLDKIHIGDVPETVTLSLAANDYTEAGLSWTQYMGGDFGYYEVYRSLTSGFLLDQELLATITSAGTTTHTDTVDPATTYYYQVFVASAEGRYLAQSNVLERPPFTLPLLAYPFSDDMESGGSNYQPDAPWAITDEVAHGGTQSWSDSPGGNYGNNTTSALTFQIDLSGGMAVHPELTFWHQYGFETNADWGFVDVSTDGGSSYVPIYYITGSGGSWLQERVDLTRFRGNVLHVRLRMSTNGSGQADGWHVDDLSIDESTTPAVAYPLVDDFNNESTTRTTWIPGSFELTTPSGDGTAYWSNRSTGNLPNFYPGGTELALGNTIDLSSGVNPQARFQYRAYESTYNSAETYFQISTDGGDTWTTLHHLPHADSWTTVQIDLSGYAGVLATLFRFYSYDGHSGTTNPYCDVENFSITDVPLDVTLSLNDNQAYQATLGWTQNTEPDFDRYVIKYGTSPGVTISSATLIEITDQGTTTYDHTGLSPYDTYYYKVFVYDDLGVYSFGSNEIERPTLEPALLSYPFSDDLESGSGNFLADLPWEITTEVAHSGTHSWSDIPGANYDNSINKSVVFQIDLDGGTAVRPELSFWHQYGLQTNSDWGFVDVSTDGGASWVEAYYITGTSGEWRQARVDLTPYRGQVPWLRFRIQTNASIQDDGWHIDDVAIGETVPPTLTFPFSDDFNDSTTTMANWIPGAWGITVPSENGSHYISTRPTGSLPDFYPGSTLLSLGGPLDLSSATYPQLRMRYRGYDSAYNGAETYLQVSQDNGETWSTLRHFGNADNWTTAQIDMLGYVGAAPILLRFQAYDGNSGGAQPWFDLEDFTFTETPLDVTLNLTDNQPYEATLSWSQSTEGDFASYLIKYGTSPGLTISSATLTTIEDVGDTTYVHSGLSPYDVYYYKVFVYDDVGLYSDGSNEVTRTSLEPALLSYPFSDDMESGGGNFLAESPWAITDEVAHSGTQSWSDSPLANYGNSVQTSLVLRIDLAGGAAVYPELSFWHQYGFETNADWGFVDVSTDGGASYLPVYYLTGSGGGWQLAEVDLTPYRGSIIHMRFRISTNGSVQADGWHIDDVGIAERSVPSVAYPFVDAFNDSTTTHDNWLPGAYQWTSPSDDGTPYWSNRGTGSLPDFYPGSTLMSLGGTIDLSSAMGPQLRIRYRAYDSTYNAAETYLQVSQNGGDTWNTIRQLTYTETWFTEQFDISAYAGGAPVLLRLQSYDGHSGSAQPWCDIEDLSVSDQPLDVTLAVTDNQEYETTVCWSASTEPDFGRYVLKRSTTSPVDLSSPTLAEFTAVEDTCYTDSGLSPYDVYYYKVFVYDQLDLYSDGSNEVQRSLQDPPLLSYPFSDDLESGGGNYIAQLPWEITDEVAHSGTHSWSDSPYVNYENSSNYSLTFKIDMSGGTAVRPVLTFWHQYGFQTNSDWGYVDASTDGGATYDPIYYISGSSGAWRQEKVDLIPYRGQVLHLRFRLYSNGSGQADGWHLDDISIAESTTGALGYPFADVFDDSTTTYANWTSGGFGRTSPSDDGTPYWTNRPTGNLPDYYNGTTILSLGNSIDLSSATNPVVRLRYRAYYSQYNNARSYLEVSQDGGDTYAILVTLNATDWAGYETSLSGYVGGDPVLLRVRSWDGLNGSSNPWCDVEDFAVTEDWQTTDMVDNCWLDYPASVWLTVGQTSPQIFSRVYEPSITDASGQGAGLLAQIGSGPAGTYPTDPGAGWTFGSTAYGGDANNDSTDIYYGTLIGGAVGEYDYCLRFSTDGGSFWIYADLDGNDMGGGGFNYYKQSQAGELVVTLEPELIISDTSLDITVPIGQTASRVITIGNDGVGPLVFTAEESSSPPTPDEVTWLSALPFTATVDPQEFELLTVSIDATSLTEGDYNAYVMLFTNDPANTRLDIPITVHAVPPSAPHLAGTVLNVDSVAPESRAFVELYSGGSLVASGTVGADGYYIIFGIAEGTYEARTYSEGYYPVTGTATVPADDVNFTLHRVPYFAPTNTHVDFYGDSSLFDGDPLRVGDVVTAQDSTGITCGAYHVQVAGNYGFLHVYGDDATTPDVDEGAEPGETITFRINGELATPSGPDTPIWTSDGDIRHVELSAYSTLTDELYLNAGWNLISFNRTPLDDNIETVLAELIAASNLVIASSFDQEWGGARTYDPDHPEFSDLWTMDPIHGYWVKIVVEDTLAVTGEIYWPDNPLPLEASWNLTSYLPEDTREVDRALESIDGLYSLVSGFDEGATTYVPDDPIHSTLTELRNDFGYWIKMDYPGDLVYDFVPGGKSLPVAPEDGEIPVASFQFTPTPWWDSFYGIADLDGTPLQVGESVVAVDPDGVICGEFVCQYEGIYGYMPIYGDDPNTPEDEGAVAGDQIRFCYTGGNNTCKTTPLTTTWRGDQSLVEFDLAFVTGVDDSQAGLPDRYFLYNAFPNPFNPVTTIKYDLPEPAHVKLSVYDMAGRLVAELVDGRETAGAKAVQWYGMDAVGRRVSSGVYFYRLVTDRYTVQKKMTLLK